MQRTKIQNNSNNPKGVLELVASLVELIERKDISYCHWKSNNALDRSANGENDLDLLVSEEDRPQFLSILSDLGFKRAIAPKSSQMPGVESYFGYDPKADKLIHVHAHYQLILGHDMTKNFRLPVEKAYLASARQGFIFKIPQPEYEYIVFVLRMMLKHFTWDAILGREGKLKKAEQEELVFLQDQIKMEQVNTIVEGVFPFIGIALFQSCVEILESKKTIAGKIVTAQRVQIKLVPFARRALFTDFILKYSRRLKLALLRRLNGSTPKFTLQRGGKTVAFLGGDGAGKSTMVDEVSNWLSKEFEIARGHMGKPSWSITTNLIRGVLKAGRVIRLYPYATSYKDTLGKKSIIPAKYPWLLREVCTARDRLLTFRRLCRLAKRGKIIFMDRYPHPQIQFMDGPQTRQAFPNGTSNLITDKLIDLEERYYQGIDFPELMIVLRVDPELAVRRKVDEPSDYVRERSTKVWNIEWDSPNTLVIDGGRSSSEVLADVKSLVWSSL